MAGWCWCIQYVCSLIFVSSASLFPPRSCKDRNCSACHTSGLGLACHISSNCSSVLTVASQDEAYHRYRMHPHQPMCCFWVLYVDFFKFWLELGGKWANQSQEISMAWVSIPLLCDRTQKHVTMWYVSKFCPYICFPQGRSLDMFHIFKIDGSAPFVGSFLNYRRNYFFFW
jgi:hypothetical protein